MAGRFTAGIFAFVPRSIAGGALVVGGAQLAACGGCNSRGLGPAPEPVAQTTLASSDSVAPRTAPATWDDLLHTTDSRLAISSKVDNPRDFPEHIADGRIDTAWNGKSGDLTGGWFGFAVPAGARVRAIDVVVGFAARSKRGDDLFLDNVRIRRVRVSRNGEFLVEHTFSTDDRGFQRIAVDAPGGEFRIEVLEFQPGRRKAWRELVVSELRVLGIAGPAALHATVMPRVAVGSFDGPAAERLPVRTAPAAAPETSVATVGDFCARFVDEERVAVERARREYEQGRLFGPEPEATCEPSSVFDASDLEVSLVEQVGADDRVRRLVVTYGDRTYRLGSAIEVDPRWDPCPHASSGAEVRGVRVEAKPGGERVVIVTIYRWSKQDDAFVPTADGLESEPGASVRVLSEIRCTLERDGPSCTEPEIARREGTERLDVLTVVPPLPW